MIIHRDRDKDTICAISSPPGTGGVILIRISGPDAVTIVRKLAAFLPESIESHRLYYGWLKSPTTRVKIDEVVLGTFLNGKSFTGEDVIEISCHGSPVVAQIILENLTSSGARLADKGEFTYRAFMHGKVDLVQAESILALIESNSKKASQLAAMQLAGGVSHEVVRLEDQLTWLLAHLEASIDFSAEDIEVIKDSVVIEKLEEIRDSLANLANSFNKGRKIVSGYSVALVGEPNVGKSSLLNAVLQEDRAIVSPLAGTTRDIVQDSIMIDGVPVIFKDTAGIRITGDVVEKIGVERSREALDKADLILLVLDPTEDLSHQIARLSEMQSLALEKSIIVINKVDLLGEKQRENAKKTLHLSLNNRNFFNSSEEVSAFLNKNLLFLSTLDKKTPGIVIEMVSERLRPGDLGTSPLVTQVRHFENLEAALCSVEKALDLAQNQSSPEFASMELKEALIRVQEIVGTRFDDQILDKIFQEFCLGK